MAINAYTLTTAGMLASASAQEKGIALRLESYSVGSAYNYVPLPTDTGLRGTVLWNDTINDSYETTDETLVVQCTMPFDVGPFDFGEIGLYLQSGELFALVSFGEPMHKIPLDENFLATAFTLKLYLKLWSGTATIVVGPGPNEGVLPISKGGTSATTASMARTTLQAPGYGGSGARDVWPISIAGLAQSADRTTSIDGGQANTLMYQLMANLTGFIAPPNSPGQYLSWNGQSFTWGKEGGSAEFNNTGYTTLSSGAILQWGVTRELNVNEGITVTFPIAFPNAVWTLATGGDCLELGRVVDLIPVFSGLSNSQVWLYPRKAFKSSGGSSKLHYMAIGY